MYEVILRCSVTVHTQCGREEHLGGVLTPRDHVRYLAECQYQATTDTAKETDRSSVREFSKLRRDSLENNIRE